MNYKIIRDEKYIQHHGVKGMKWGVRRNDEYGNRRKGSVIFAPHRAILKPMMKNMTKNDDKMRKRADQIDNATIKYETKK